MSLPFRYIKNPIKHKIILFLMTEKHLYRNIHWSISYYITCVMHIPFHFIAAKQRCVLPTFSHYHNGKSYYCQGPPKANKIVPCSSNTSYWYKWYAGYKWNEQLRAMCLQKCTFVTRDLQLYVSVDGNLQCVY